MVPEPIRVLLIEDNPSDVELIREYLSDVQPVQIELEHFEHLSGGLAGLARLSQCLPDVVLLDLNLPDSEGLDTFQRLHADQPNVPVVVLTVLDVDGLGLQALGAGAEDYLPKSELRPRLLVRTIQYAIERARRRWAEKTLDAANHSLHAARKVQEGLHPKAPPSATGYDIAGASFPSEAVGGDYLDFIPMLDESLGLAIGDASGHGLGSALLAAEVRATLRALTCTYRGVGEILTLANRILSECIPEGCFITLMFARLEHRAGILVYSSAGHPYPVIFDVAGHVRERLPSMGLPLGIEVSHDFTSSGAVSLNEGDALLFHSDGLVEASNPDGTQFGLDRMQQVVRDHLHLPARAIIDHLYEEVLEHCRPNPPADDVTAIVLKVEAGAVRSDFDY